MKAMEISQSALDVEWQRFEIIAQNLANLNTVRTATGEPYRVQRLVSGPAAGFPAFLGGRADSRGFGGVQVYGIESVSMPDRKVLDPSNPAADKDGFVSMPGFDLASEMTLMIKTQRAYESNIVTMNLARQMYGKALELGHRA